MAVLLIAHDLGLVAGRADRVAVMYAGQIVEEAAHARLFRSPAHPYTQALFRSIPRIDTPVERLSPIRGGVPPPMPGPAACRFHPRCDEVLPRCSVETPPVVPLAPGRSGALLARGPGTEMTRPRCSRFGTWSPGTRPAGFSAAPTAGSMRSTA
jgi:oligopeptide/dipeptide ABC transporter ATP-binding protein